jgi:hypothetical protein
MDVTTKGLNGNALKVIAINKKKQGKTALFPLVFLVFS